MASYKGWRCAYCDTVMDGKGGKAPTRDHVIPKAKGGTSDRANILIVCRSCNGDKGCMSLEMFVRVLQFQRDSRAERVAAIAAQRSTPATVAAE